MPDDLTSALDEIRERAAAMKSSAHGYVARGERLPGGPCGEWLIANLAAAVDVPLLLAAIERVLELTDEWERKADEADDRAEAASGRGDGGASLLLSGRGQALHDCSFALREAIRAELTKGESSHA